MQRSQLILITGITVLSIALSMPIFIENIIYDSPSDVNSQNDGTFIIFVGTITSKGNDRQGVWGIGDYIEIDGFNGRIACEKNDFQIGEKVIVKGYFKRNTVSGDLPPGIIAVHDWTPPAVVSRVWWPAISEIGMIAGTVIIFAGIADTAYNHRQKVAKSG